MIWLYLLATVTILTIALRRVVLRQKPLSDESFSRAVAFEHVQSGIAWVHSEGRVGSMNASFAGILGMEPQAASGMKWRELFAQQDAERLDEAYSRMLLAGKEKLAVNGRNARGLDEGEPDLDLLMVAVHDHKMRFVGHYCLVADRRRERALEGRLRELRYQLEEAEAALALQMAVRTPAAKNAVAGKSTGSPTAR